jgi:DNA-binding NarL/FixJ family response regulator
MPDTAARGGAGGEGPVEDTQRNNAVITVLIADDHAVLREGLHGLLDEYEDISVIGEATTGLDAVRKTRELKPQILLLDLIMPELGGIEALEAINAQPNDTKVIVLTGVDDDSMLMGAIQAGAQGYLLKDAASSQIVEAIRCVATGNCWLPPGLTDKLFRGMSKRPETDPGSKLATLTAREMEVLRLVGDALTNAAIGEMLFISEATVKSHMGRIMEKLDLESRAEAVRFAIHHGLTKA